MADEAKVVGVARGWWTARCLLCAWTYSGQCREVDMALRGHVVITGHDANAWDADKKLCLKLERDVRGRVVHRPPEPEPWVKKHRRELARIEDDEEPKRLHK